MPEAVADAEPTLERRLIKAPIVTGITSVVEVTGEGMTHVEQEMTYLLPEDDPAPTMRWTLPLRRAFSRDRDQVFRITNVAVDGATDMQERLLSDRATSETHQDMELDVTVMNSDGNATLTLSYDVEGAVATDGDTSHARWALAPFGLKDADTIDFTWNLPADVDRVACTTISEYLDEPRECVPQPALKSSGNTVSWLREGTGPMAPPDAWIGSDLPAGVDRMVLTGVKVPTFEGHNAMGASPAASARATAPAARRTSGESGGATRATAGEEPR